MQGPFWESWSLAVEEWFYLLFPILLFLVQQLKQISAKNKFALALLLFTFIPFTLRVFKGIEMQVDGYGWDIHFRKMVFLRLDSIAIGIWMAWLQKYYPHYFSYRSTLFMIIGFACFFYLDTHQAQENSFFNKVLRFPLYSLCFAMVIPYFYAIKNGKGFLLQFFTHFSKISYSMYLINLGLVASVIHHKIHPLQGSQSLLWYGIYWMVVILASSAIYKYFEKPITDLRERLR